MDIEKVTEKVKQNRHFSDNQDLLDSFVDLAVSRLEGIEDSILDKEAYSFIVNRIISKAVVDTLKSTNRYSNRQVKRLQKIDYREFDFDNTSYNAPSIPDSKLIQLYKILKKADENNVNSYFQIINLKYKQNKTLNEIAEELRLSREEVSDILFILSDYSYKVANV